MVILFITFLVGIILFFDTSIDTFVLWMVGLLKNFVEIIKVHVFGSISSSKGKVAKQGEFIEDLSQKATAPVQKVAPASALATQSPSQTEELHMKLFNSEAYKNWQFPPLDLLSLIKEGEPDYGDIAWNSDTIERTLDSFGLRARVSEVNKGPTVTQYALQIAVGVKVSKITTLANDLALALAAPSGQVRIEAPIPGRSLVGIEIPNKKAQIVSLRSLLESPELADKTKPLLVPLGLDVSGKIQVVDITTLPHTLIAGTTGSGKSVLLTAWITSILFRTTPNQVRLLLVDPKRVEFSGYNGVPHLMAPVIVDPKKIVSALQWAVKEMERRYKVLAEVGARNIVSYNTRDAKDIEPMPYIVFIIDELADLMMYAANEVEQLITRIAQMARAVGIHLVLATQRPSVDVITGLMKSNIPARIAFNVPSMIDSRVVLDSPGAEKLLGKGDMLYLPPNESRPKRIQSAYLEEKEVHTLVEFLKKGNPRVDYTDEITEQEVSVGKGGQMSSGGEMGSDKDPLYNEAWKAISDANQASASLLQRRLQIGYARAARILDQLLEAGVITQSQGSKAREILLKYPIVPAPGEAPMMEQE